MSLNLVLRKIAGLGCLILILAGGLALTCGRADAEDATAVPRIAANSNQTPAGTMAGGTLNLELEAREGEWFPEDEHGPSLKVFALQEKGKGLQIPGPMIRVPQGTTIHVQVHNLLAAALVMYGLHSHPGKVGDVFEIPPGQTREVSFLTGEPGAHYYWATAGGDTLDGRPYKEDGQLTGAFLVDPPGAAIPDRVFLISVWRNKQLPQESLDIPVINGKSWPYTERLEYVAGSDVRWRWLNSSANIHPMHMHGSYFRVDGVGDGESDTVFPPEQRKKVVTQLMPVGGTMTTDWQPTEPGRWIFHCHILTHVSPDTMMLRQTAKPEHAEMSHRTPEHEMAGLVMGITVLPRPGESKAAKTPTAQRQLDLVIGSQNGGASKSGYALGEHGQAIAVSAPGQTLVLTQGEPVAIRVINRLAEPTSVHWHGIELQSYYDGVSGWGGVGDQVTPMIAPGKSFDVYFNPPRPGTFIYHTHMNDLSQLGSGLYGPIIVLPRGETYQPETDRVFLISRNGMRKDGELLLNGGNNPQLQHWKAGVDYRLRFIDICANNTIKVNLSQDGSPVTWKAIAKDGADLPAEQALAGPAAFVIAPGETYDFRVRPERDGEMQLSLDLVLLKEKLTQAIRVEAGGSH